MKTITDSAGRTWDVSINVLTIGRVRDEMQLNLLEAILPDNRLLERLSGDVIDLARVLYLICRDEARAAGVEQEAFYAALTRDSLEDGLRAILDGVVNFSPSGLRPAYRKVLEKSQALAELEEKRLKKAIASPEFDTALDQAMKREMKVGRRATATSGRKRFSNAASISPVLPTSTSADRPPAGTASAV